MYFEEATAVSLLNLREDKLLLRPQQLYLLDSPTKRNQQAVIDIIWNDASLSSKDRDYIRHEDDLITFDADHDSSWVHRVVGFFFKWTGEDFLRVRFGLNEQALSWINRPLTILQRLFRSDIQRKKASGNPLGIQPFQRLKFNKGVEYVFAFFQSCPLSAQSTFSTLSGTPIHMHRQRRFS